MALAEKLAHRWARRVGGPGQVQGCMFGRSLSSRVEPGLASLADRSALGRWGALTESGPGRPVGVEQDLIQATLARPVWVTGLPRAAGQHMSGRPCLYA